MCRKQNAILITSFGHVGRATATALGDHRVLNLDPLAHLDGVHRASGRLGARRQAVVLLQHGRRAAAVGAPAVPPQQRLVMVPGGPAVHAGRHRARRLALGAVALEQPPRPEPLAQVLPLLLNRANGPAPQVLLDLAAQLPGYTGPQPPAVGQREVLGVQVADFRRHLTGRHQPAPAIPPVNNNKTHGQSTIHIHNAIINESDAVVRTHCE